jgi:hypothetical protein
MEASLENVTDRLNNNNNDAGPCEDLSVLT